MPWFVYILECKNKALYTGITTDITRRLKEHRLGEGCRYTSYNPGLKIRYFETYKTRSKALKREARIKKMPRKEKLSLIRAGS